MQGFPSALWSVPRFPVSLKNTFSQSEVAVSVVAISRLPGLAALRGASRGSGPGRQEGPRRSEKGAVGHGAPDRPGSLPSGMVGVLGRRAVGAGRWHVGT